MLYTGRARGEFECQEIFMHEGEGVKVRGGCAGDEKAKGSRSE
jgi:hypothetical protein